MSEHPVDDLDQRIFDQAAWFAGGNLLAVGVALIHLAPGDMTNYQILVARPELWWEEGELRTEPRRDYEVVLLNDFGGAYPWSGQQVHSSYAEEKWVTYRKRGTPTGIWAAQVMARFLNTLSERLKG